MVELKTEGDVKLPAEAYAYTPDMENSSTWKLRLWKTPEGGLDKKYVSMAAAAFSSGGFRGQKVDIPNKDVEKVKTKIRNAWKEVNPDKTEDMMPEGIKKESILDKIRNMLKEYGITKEETEDMTDSINVDDNVNVEKNKMNIEELRKQIEDEVRKEEASKIEKLEKQVEELKKKEAEEELKKKEAEEELRKQEFITKASDFKSLPIETEKLGIMLKAISDSTDDNTYENLNTLLKSVDEVLKQSELFKEIGVSSSKEIDTQTRIDTLVQKKIAEKGINKHKAYTEVLMENPDIVREVL